MSKGRLEAFSDGVVAILITIMVLEFRVPHGADWAALRPVLPVFSTYVLSYVFLGIYWNNHHHLLHAATKVNGKILWANLHLLFWLSLVPFVTGWMGESRFAPIPTAAYGAVQLASAIAYTVLQTAILAAEEPGSRLQEAIGSDFKGRISLVLYLVGIPIALVLPLVGAALYVVVALMWFVPDRRIESRLNE